MTNYEFALQKIEEVKQNGTRYLDLSGLNLEYIPGDINELWQLFDIDLSFNNLTSFPTVLAEMTNLRSLNLSYNYLTELPFIFGKYYSLKELNISNNLFSNVPDELELLEEIEDIIFDGNPFYENLPLEIRETEDIFYIKFFLNSFKLKREPKKLFETKILIVGKGEVGKTTLMKVIHDPKYKVKIGREETTHGININGYFEELYFPAKDPYYTPFFDFDDLFFDENGTGTYSDRTKFLNIEDSEEFQELFEDLDEHPSTTQDPHQTISSKLFVKKNVKVNIWDFGGQEILYSTHQFFLTQRSIYVLVWEPRSDSYEENFDYWLNVINRLGKDSPIIVVMNKCDVSYKNIDERRYLNEFSNIVGFFKISCLTKEGVRSFKDKLMHCVTNLKHMGDRLPVFWEEIRKKLQESDSDYISYTEFKNICKIEDEKQVVYLASYLSDLGDIIYFNNELSLQNLVITNPHWLTKAIYELIHSLEVQKNDGLLEAENLTNLLNKKTYPKDKHLEILSLMEKFEICFKVLGSKNKYVIPALLKASPNDPQLINQFKTPEALKYQVQYYHMPSGIIERLICRLSRYLEGNNYWKLGAVFNTEHSRALVYVDNIKKTIVVTILGEIKTDTYNLISNSIKEIHDDLKLKNEDWSELIACICAECIASTSPYMFNIDVLKKFKYKDKETIDCNESTDSVNINELLSGYRKTKNASNSILREVIDAVSSLQSRHKMIELFDENQINLFLQDLLRPKIQNKGLITNEQSLKGSSSSGKQVGELDISIETIEGISITFLEGFILKSFNKTVIDNHVLKVIKNYDPNGLKEKFMTIYCYSDNYLDLIQKYCSHINQIQVSGITLSPIEDLSRVYISGSELKVFRSKYIRNETKLVVYHLLINLQY